ncbi:MAG: hypothetical protein XD78_0949 [Desulfotomaculum sp. 46_296]|nr:MAG: hypothetical protein XD78_0949 [Desulfotomaculum sp. 46_296]
MYYLLIDPAKKTVLAENLQIASNPLQRMSGLLGKNYLPYGEGLLLVPCNSIHTFFMRFPIDILFLDRFYKVLRIVENLQPYRLALHLKAFQTVELPAGTVCKLNTEVGSNLTLLKN